ncbi:MAG: RCC1-like domain-containing protein [Anaeroplasmataceae bacterium]
MKQKDEVLSQKNGECLVMNVVQDFVARNNESQIITDCDHHIWVSGWNNFNQLGLKNNEGEHAFFSENVRPDLRWLKNPEAKIVKTQMCVHTTIIKSEDGEFLVAGVNRFNIRAGTKYGEKRDDDYLFKPVVQPIDSNGNECVIEDIYMSPVNYVCITKCGKMFIKGLLCGIAPPYNRFAPSISYKWEEIVCKDVKSFEDAKEIVDEIVNNKREDYKRENKHISDDEMSKLVKRTPTESDKLKPKYSIIKEGGLRVLGCNKKGALGDGTDESKSKFVEVKDLKGIKFKKIHCRPYESAFALTMDGDLWTCGLEPYNRSDMNKCKINWFWKKIDSKYKFKDFRLTEFNIYLKTKCGLEWIDEIDEKPLEAILNNE